MIQLWHKNGQILQVDDSFDIDRPTTVRLETEQIPIDLLMNYYVDVTVELRERPVLSVPAKLTAKVGETITVAVPDPVTISFGGEAQVVTGGTLELSSETPDTFTIMLSAWPYRDATIEVEFTNGD